MVRGNTRTFTIAVTAVGGVGPFDLTGCTMWFSVRAFAAAPDYVFQKKTGGGGIVIATPASGVAVITVQNADTAGLPSSEQQLVYDVQLKTTDGSIVTLSRGTLIVQPDVTEETT